MAAAAPPPLPPPQHASPLSNLGSGFGGLATQYTTQFTTQFNYLYASADAEDAARVLVAEGGTPFGQLLLAVFNSIFQVFLLCVAGYILAKNGILDKKTQKQINRLNVSLFTPALLFSKVAFYLTPEKLKELWIIPIWFFIVTCASMAVARVLGWAFKLRQSQKSFVAAAAMFMNSNALPIALMQSLVVSVPDLAWGSDDNKNAMLGRALTYLTMYSTLGMVVRYSYGVALLSRADTILMPPNETPGARDGDNDECAPLLGDHDGQGDREGEGGRYCCYDTHDEPLSAGYASASTLAAHPSNKSLSRPESPDHSEDGSGGNDRSYASVVASGPNATAAAAPTATPASAIPAAAKSYMAHEGEFVGSPAAFNGSSGSPTLRRGGYFPNRTEDDDPTPRATTTAASTGVAYADASTQVNTKSPYTMTPNAAAAPAPVPPVPSASATIGAGIAERLARPAPARRNTTFYNSFPNSPNRSRPDLPGLEEDEDESASDSESSSGLSGSEFDEEEGEDGRRNTGVDIEAQTPVRNAVTKGLVQGGAGHGGPAEGLNGGGRPSPHARRLSTRSRRSQLRGPHHHHHHHHHHHNHHTSSGYPPTLLGRTRYLLHRLYLRVNRAWAAFCSFMTVPLWSALCSLVVACFAPVKHALENHMQPVNEAISTCGKCAVPLTLVVLGAYFYVPPSPEEDLSSAGAANGTIANGAAAERRKAKKLGLWKRIVKRAKALVGRGDGTEDLDAIKRRQQQNAANRPRPKETMTVVLAILARMVLTPLLLVPLMVWATSEDWHAVFEDPVFVVVNTLLLCSPPALTLAQITAAVSGDAFERLISRTIFWSYCIVTPLVTIGSVLMGLWLADM